MEASSTQEIPTTTGIPRHVAIIMDGNGRWARNRHLPRLAGHRAGVEAVRRVVQACAERQIRYLTVFAFSSENWRRPRDEVSLLMELFATALSGEALRLHKNGVRLKVIGELTAFSSRIQKLIARAEALTEENQRLTLTIAANYGGRWDLLQAVSKMLGSQAHFPVERISEAHLAPFLAMNYAPEPDLFVRTGGEQRISNFMLWNLAYTELYFTDLLWPDFDGDALDEAINWYSRRERRFGRTSEQLMLARTENCTSSPLGLTPDIKADA